MQCYSALRNNGMLHAHKFEWIIMQHMCCGKPFTQWVPVEKLLWLNENSCPLLCACPPPSLQRATLMYMTPHHHWKDLKFLGIVLLHVMESWWCKLRARKNNSVKLAWRESCITWLWTMVMRVLKWPKMGDVCKCKTVQLMLEDVTVA